VANWMSGGKIDNPVTCLAGAGAAGTTAAATGLAGACDATKNEAMDKER